MKAILKIQTMAVITVAMLPVLGICGDTSKTSAAETTVESKGANPYRCELETADYSNHFMRVISSKSKDAASEPEVRLAITILILGPEDRKVLKSSFTRMTHAGKRSGIVPPDNQPSPLEKAEDDTGKDLTGEFTYLQGRVADGRAFKISTGPARRILGTLVISGLEPRAEASKGLVSIKGVVYLTEITETETLEVNPISSGINTPIVLHDGTTVAFTLPSKGSVQYKAKWVANSTKTDKTATPSASPSNTLYEDLEIAYYAADGKEIKAAGGLGNSGMNGGSMELSHTAILGKGQDIPKDAYAVIKYPKKTKIVEIPFEFKDFQLPRNPP